MAKVGRPTKYKKAYCKMLIEHMRQGFSFDAFAGITGHSKQTLYEWVAAHPDFGDAKKVAEALAQVFWEKKGIDHVEVDKNNPTELNTTLWIFNMKNRFRWTDRQTKDLSDATDQELEAELTRRMNDSSPKRTS